MDSKTVKSLLANEPFYPLVLSLRSRSQHTIHRSEDAKVSADGSVLEVIDGGRQSWISMDAICSITVDVYASQPLVVDTTKTE
jgi:hypothetical protein